MDKGLKLCNSDSNCGNYIPAIHNRLFSQMRQIILKNSFRICFQHVYYHVYRRTRGDLKQIITLIKFCLCQTFFAQCEVRKKAFTAYVHDKNPSKPT